MAFEDYLYSYKDIYRALPSPIRSIAGRVYRCFPVSMRFGTAYSETRKEIASTKTFSKPEIEAFQIQHLNSLLKHCFASVPYYREIWKKIGIGEPTLHYADDIRVLPLLTKDIVRKHKLDLTAENISSKKHLPMNTGGSTGTPLDLLYEKGISRSREWAFIHNIWARAGWKDGDRTVMLRGWSIPGGQYWQFEPVRNRLIMSAFHLNRRTIPLYIDAIRKFQPAFIEAYPSNVSIISQYMIANKIVPFSSLKGILLGSENIFPHQRAIIRKAFNCQIVSWYGHGELCALGGECEHSTDYHMFPSYGFVELLDTSGHPITKPGVLGEIVATGFNSAVMPLIRYKTGDMGVIADGHCDCGRQWPRLSRVEGRKQELVVAKDGSVITLTALIFGQHYNAFANIVRMQLAQSEPGKVIVRIEPAESYSIKRDEKEILSKIESAVGNSLQIEFQYPHSISRTASGKHIFLEQSLSIDQYLSI